MTKNEAVHIILTMPYWERFTDDEFLAMDVALKALIRKTGKWIIDDPIHMHSTCSCCGYYNIDTPSFNYCPYCGAYMERIENEK